MKGLLFTLEGPEKAGKTTTLNLLKENLPKKYGITPVFLREPGGTSIGDQIREVILHMKNQEMDAGTELLLYAASRRQIVSEFVKPNLENGNIVIMDRYADSTRAYQGEGRGIDKEAIEFLINFATYGIVPDKTFLFDIDIEVALARANKDVEWNRMDAQAVDFYKKAMVRYHQLVQEESDRWCVIDASKSIDEVYRDVETKIVEKLENYGLIEGQRRSIER
ncbi:MAG TPA: dTMP kinase [Candidatus Saccharimonadales bacterium]|nr:dTMP kinase [Candidatus Saccharimonadales bacterium]